MSATASSGSSARWFATGSRRPRRFSNASLSTREEDAPPAPASSPQRWCAQKRGNARGCARGSAGAATVDGRPQPRTTPFAELVLERVRTELSASEFLQGELAEDVMLVVRAVVNFLAARLNAPKPYQREDGKGATAVEGDLQDDLDWLRSGALLQGVPVYEPQKVGAGRADISVAFTAHQVVNELKRETRDAGHDAMAKTYAEQGSSYDATDYPFGLVTVLDVSAEPPTTPRLEARVWVHRHEDEGGIRWLVFVRVPGRLSTPSAHTRRAH